MQADGVDVVAPLRVPEREIGAFVQRHRDWVLAAKVRALLQTLQAHRGPARLAAGGRILWRGHRVNPHALPVAGGGRSGLLRDEY